MANVLEQMLQLDLTHLLERQGNATAAMKKMIADYDEALDTIWMLLAALLVFFMHAGFSMLEAGSVRKKNTQNILAKNLCVISLGFLSWWSFGYAFALGPGDKDPNRVVGYKGLFMDEFWDTKSNFKVWFFQGAFCATAATIVSGAMAERTQLKGFAIYTVLMTTIIYPFVVYWGWSSNGWLNYKNQKGESVASFGPWYRDFAGSGIVHMVGGIGALCGAVAVGARKGWKEAKDLEEYAPHSIPFCVFGTFCLWFGWYGFNPGSTLAMKTTGNAYQAGQVAVNTTLAPCVAGLLVFALRAALPPNKLDVSGFCNGILAGLVAITAGCGFVKSWEAIVIGLIGGLVYQGASMTLKMLKVDDVVDAFAVHGATGAWGVISLGFFGDPALGDGRGFFHESKSGQFGTQFLAVIVIAIWTAGLSIVILAPLSFMGWLRMSDEVQDAGADVIKHSPPKAYGSASQIS